MKRFFAHFWNDFNKIVAIAIFWATVTFFLGLAFGTPLPGQKAPMWYLVVSYFLEETAYLGASLLCFRNWCDRQIVSDRNIWLSFGCGNLTYLIGNFFFIYWELILKRVPDVSLADPFFILAYLFLLLGMLLAVKSRSFYLRKWQWLIIIIAAAIAIWLGWLVTNPPEDAQATLLTAVPHSDIFVAENSSFLLNSTPQEQVPTWVIAIEETLEPLTAPLSLLYVINDVLLLIMATTLLLTFWGGRFSQTWTLISLAVLFLYIADIRYAYVVTRTDYETNSIIDTFWTLSAIIFNLAAAWEYKISIRPRRR